VSESSCRTVDFYLRRRGRRKRSSASWRPGPAAGR
jgi:hypothetical protein